MRARWGLVLLPLLLGLPLQAGDKGRCEVAVAALKLPDPDSGLVYWSSGDTPTRPLELNTRSFSGRVTVVGGVMDLHQEPVARQASGKPRPDPWVSVTIPAGARMVYVVLFEERDPQGVPNWRGVVIDAEGWEAGSIRVFNATAETLGFDAGDTTFQLEPETHVDVSARKWKRPFPVRFYRVRPTEKLLFASTWRVVSGRREVCFLNDEGRSVSLKSIVDPAIPPAVGAP